MSDPRRGHRHRQAVAWARRHHTTCIRCGKPINMQLTFPHRGSWTLEHLLEVDAGGDPYAPTNLAASHLACNSAAGARYGNTKHSLGQRSRT